ncbi:hypothetical protein BU14_0629s0004 [Porphyra umbilicalis]|uniref:Uncharacterized protein n=1 Tax=Porphyra umbilicalis TaxID=2786 RepID=A0A1X6NQX2_PORUM|nr:hypothetical protein BU14_0629s0004 [Porphyra umbilicalis]|eukprot:OSX70930.1 hypothetical protein BU14_0629s0004 [Porphyra umbilicalis]
MLPPRLPLPSPPPTRGHRQTPATAPTAAAAATGGVIARPWPPRQRAPKRGENLPAVIQALPQLPLPAPTAAPQAQLAAAPRAGSVGGSTPTRGAGNQCRADNDTSDTTTRSWSDGKRLSTTCRTGGGLDPSLVRAHDRRRARAPVDGCVDTIRGGNWTPTPPRRGAAAIGAGGAGGGHEAWQAWGGSDDHGPTLPRPRRPTDGAATDTRWRRPQGAVAVLPPAASAAARRRARRRPRACPRRPRCAAVSPLPRGASGHPARPTVDRSRRCVGGGSGAPHPPPVDGHDAGPPPRRAGAPPTPRAAAPSWHRDCRAVTRGDSVVGAALPNPPATPCPDAPPSTAAAADVGGGRTHTPPLCDDARRRRRRRRRALRRRPPRGP